MRLIHVDTLEIREFATRPPPYAILSHRWAQQEVSYEQYLDPQRRRDAGFQKIIDFCNLLPRPEPAKDDRGNINMGRVLHVNAEHQCFEFNNGFEWIWMDTCCIDKRSSAELSEAINSMWNWYRDARLCVVYLADVASCTADQKYDRKERLYAEASQDAIRRSNWFLRGWTLQELLAPRSLIFCNQKWEVIGSRESLRSVISLASNIPEEYISNDPRRLNKASIAQRLSWASHRLTTRKEDRAYCLLGLLGVNMSLLYGEGAQAFRRLQEEVLRRSDDETLFAWSYPKVGPIRRISGLFAHSPKLFYACGRVERCDFIRRKPLSITHKGVEITAPLLRIAEEDHVLGLNCRTAAQTQLLLPLLQVSENVFVRLHLSEKEKLEEPYRDLQETLRSVAIPVLHEATIYVQDATAYDNATDPQQKPTVAAHELL